ncbi:hypothetical protein T07_9252 [Trichinella nelsoni]|uniref:Uncharacterized protein n=1 Tax=Trichinella nelsoni TaxID=6336 RepID=A0A0V0RTQ8_9BILA|nr:hypothetical protein T07_9252 [Trichinella nelsoni]
MENSFLFKLSSADYYHLKWSLAHFSSFIERLIDNTVTIILLFYTKQSVAFLTTDVACWQKQVDNGVVV